jgi:hypothetical protein
MNEDEDFLKAISQATGSRKNVNIRFEKIKKVIKNTLND